MAKDNNHNLAIRNPVGKADAGTKGAKRSWTGTVEYDLRKIPADLLEEFLHSGIRQWLKNSAASIPVEADGIAAMRARLAKLEAGDMDRTYHFASPIDRRALDNLFAALQQGAAAAQLKTTEADLRKLARDTLDGADGQAWKDEAKRQMEEEAKRASAGGQSLAKALQALQAQAPAQAAAEPSKS